jgi:hypothetical protein
MSSRGDPGRRSRLVTDPAEDLRLLFADLHNHSLHSDGRGDPEQAFRQLREAGLDVAALTDHASIPHADLARLSLADYPDVSALAIGRLAPRSFDAAAWKRTAELADAGDVPGEFTALRGFEWTEPWLGHVNVWFSDRWTGVTTPGRIQGLHDFLVEDEPSALFGYNHPGREPGRLDDFALPPDRPELPGRMVALEAINRTYDFLFEGWHPRGSRSPIAECLDAGWRPGLIGSSDEHGRSYGLVGKGRAGLWAPSHTREGVRDALLSRRTFATREVGLRLDATLDGVPMGSGAAAGPHRAELAVDLGTVGTPAPSISSSAPSSAAGSSERRGAGWSGHPVELQLLVGSSSDHDGGVRVVAQIPGVVGELIRAEVPVPDGARWLLLRVADPRRPAGSPAPPNHPAACWALAYASPWYLD